MSRPRPLLAGVCLTALLLSLSIVFSTSAPIGRKLQFNLFRLASANNSRDTFNYFHDDANTDFLRFQSDFEQQLDDFATSRIMSPEEGSWVAGSVLETLERTGQLPETAPPDRTGCTWRFISYESSALEWRWINDLFRLFDFATHSAFCFEIGRQVEQLQFWIRNTHRAARTHRRDPLLDRVFSRFLYLESCPGAEPREVVSYIEPLAGPLRHPLSVCTDLMREDLWNQLRTSKDYLVLPSSASPEVGPLFDRSLRAQSLLLDAGASTWTPPSYDIGGASISWFWNKLVPRGLKPDRILAWEITPHNESVIYKGVPDEALPILQYMNVGVDNATNSPRNPLEIIRRIGRKEDYISFKLDIDCPMEEYFVDQLLSDSQLLALVDEFFFESHGNFSAAVGVWGPEYGAEGDTVSRYRLSEIYEKLLNMREMGVRAHPWP